MPGLEAWLTALRLAPALLELLAAGRFALGALPYPLSGGAKWRAAGYGLVLYLYGMPLVASALYWFSGSAVYTSGIILLLLLLGLAGRCHQASSTRQRAVWGRLGVGVAGLVVGTNELYIVVAIVRLIGWAMLARRRAWPGAMVLTTAWATFTLLAPGNLARAATVVNTVPAAAYRCQGRLFDLCAPGTVGQQRLAAGRYRAVAARAARVAGVPSAAVAVAGLGGRGRAGTDGADAADHLAHQRRARAHLERPVLRVFAELVCRIHRGPVGAARRRSADRARGPAVADGRAAGCIAGPRYSPFTRPTSI